MYLFKSFCGTDSHINHQMVQSLLFITFDYHICDKL